MLSFFLQEVSGALEPVDMFSEGFTGFRKRETCLVVLMIMYVSMFMCYVCFVVWG